MTMNIGEANDITVVLRFLSTDRYEDDRLTDTQVTEALVRLRDRAAKALQMNLDHRYPTPIIEGFVMEWRDGEAWDYEGRRPVEDVDTKGRT